MIKEIYRLPFQGERYTHYIEVDVPGLNVKKGREDVFVVLNEKMLDVTQRITRYGSIDKEEGVCGVFESTLES